MRAVYTGQQASYAGAIMQAVLTTYLVISPLPVVVEETDGFESTSYPPGSAFQALSNNPSVARLLGINHIVEFAGPPSTGSTIVVGPQGPPGPGADAGWIDDGSLVRLITAADQVSAGQASPIGTVKFTIDASAGGFVTGLLVVSGAISSPGAGGSSERFGLGSLAAGPSSLALGNAASSPFASSTAVGASAVTTGNFGAALGASASAGLDSVAAGSSAVATQSSVATGRSASATGLRSIAAGAAAISAGDDSVLVGANGSITAAQTVVVGATGSATAAGAQALGYGASASGIDASAWGRGAASTFAGAHAWGAGAATTAINQFVFGGDANPIAGFYFGKGEAAITAQAVTLSSSRISATQTDEAGSDLVIVAGPGTGNATPSTIQFRAAPAGATGNLQQVLATQMVVGQGVSITNWLNVGSTVVANAVGEIAASDGTSLLHWDPAVPQLNIGLEGVVTAIRGIDSIVAGVAGASLDFISGTGLTTGAGGASRFRGGAGGAAGVGGLAEVSGGSGAAGGGAVLIIGGPGPSITGGVVTVSGGPGTTAGALVARGGITDAVGGLSGTGTFSGGDASATQVSLAADGIFKGGDGVSNNNSGAHAFIRGGVAAGGGTHGRVQIETGGAGRWQVTNTGQLLAVTDNSFDIGATASGRPRDLFVGRDAVIDGNLTVNGTTTTIDSEIQTADNFILLNSEYTSDAAQTAGLVLNIDPAATSFSISDIASDVITVVAGDPSAALSAADFLLIQDPANPANAGIYEVLSATASTVTIDATPVEAFSGTSLVDDATVQGTIVGLQVAALRSNAVGVFQTATGTAAPLTWVNIVTGVVESSQVLIDYNTSALTVGDCVRIISADTAGLTDADSDTTSDFIGVIKIVGTLGTGKVVSDGVVPVRFAGGLTLGATEPVFLAETTGTPTDGLATNVEPTTVGAVSYQIGYIKNASTYAGTEGELAEVQLRFNGRVVIAV